MVELLDKFRVPAPELIRIVLPDRSIRPVPARTMMLALVALVSRVRVPADLMVILPLPEAEPEETSMPPRSERRAKVDEVSPPAMTKMLVSLAEVSSWSVPADLRYRTPLLE